MKIVICYMYFSGYSAACWRELASRPGVELKIITPLGPHLYDHKVLDGLAIDLIPNKDFFDLKNIGKLITKVRNEHPDLIFVSGWTTVYRKLINNDGLKSIPKIIFVDTMWEWRLKMLLSKLFLHRMVKNSAGMVVAGERGRCFAEYIGYKPNQIFSSCYGYDATLFNACYANRIKMFDSWPRSFAFVGRLVKIKGIDTMITAYRKYREWAGDAAWQLHCYGDGEFKGKLNSIDGIKVHGFVQPDELASVLVNAGVFVLPSNKDPWGVALAEGAGAGLPLLVSDAVSSSVDVVRHLYNGFVFPARDAKRLFDGFCWMHNHYDQLPEFGRRSMMYAGAYTPSVWTDRVLDIARSVGMIAK